MERHILREWTSSFHKSSSGRQGMPRLAPPYKPYRQRQPNASDRLHCPWLDSRFSSLSLNQTARLSRGFLQVTHMLNCPDTLPSSCSRSYYKYCTNSSKMIISYCTYSSALSKKKKKKKKEIDACIKVKLESFFSEGIHTNLKGNGMSYRDKKSIFITEWLD